MRRSLPTLLPCTSTPPYSLPVSLSPSLRVLRVNPLSVLPVFALSRFRVNSFSRTEYAWPNEKAASPWGPAACFNPRPSAAEQSALLRRLWIEHRPRPRGHVLVKVASSRGRHGDILF